MLKLRKIDENNFMDVFDLGLDSGQEKYVSNPTRSLAQAYVYRNQCQPFGIYAGSIMVGYVLVIYDYETKEYNIWHMMIDKKYQRHGCGSEALDLIINYIKTMPFGESTEIILTCNRENYDGLNLFKKKGFKETGKSYEEEVEFVLPIV